MMINRQNLHTHSLFCDGRDTLEELANEALSHNLSSLGYSSHVYTGFPFDPCAIKKEQIDEYFSSIDSVKERYSGRLEIFKGFEYESRNAETDNPPLDPRLDYSIGSVHFFHLTDGVFAVDNTVEEFERAKESAGGIKALCQSFYDEVVRFALVSDYTITGHFDLITKFIERTGDTFQEERWYQELALSALDAVAERGKIFEVNTGAIARGYRSTPYPSPFLIRRLCEKHIPIILTSDCHDRRNLTCHFLESEELLRSLEVKEIYYLTADGFKPMALQ